MPSANKGLFVWYEHLTKDPQAAIAFYGEVVGWKTQPFPGGGGYIMWVGSQGPLGGVMELPEQAAKMGAPPHWMAHVQVDDVDATAALTKKLGGKVHKEPTDIPTVGRFAVIADPQGAAIAIFTPNSEMTLQKRVGGMMTTPKGAPMPPMWLYYVETSDLDAAMGRATKKGAKVMNGPMDVPGGGRIAQLMDPQGVAFALHQAPKS